MSAINPYEDLRKELEGTCGAKTVFIKCPVEKCIERDIKGLYAKALSGEIKNFTGISDPFEEPSNPALIVNTSTTDLIDSVAALEDFILSCL